MTNMVHKQSKLELITRKWWFFLLFVLLQFTVPPYASKGYNFPQDWGKVISHALGNAVVYQHPQIYPIFKIIPIILLIGVFVFQNKLARLLALYVCFSYMFFAIGQSVAVTDKYGVSICTVNIIMFAAVAAFWLWEAVVLQNDFTLTKQRSVATALERRRPLWRYWVVPLAVLAFWAPAGRGKPDFNPVYLFTNGAGTAFCMMTPVYVGLLTLYWPKVNMATLRVTSLVGFIISLYNMHLNFIVAPGTRWWNGVLHIPLLVISLYGLILSLKRTPASDS